MRILFASTYPHYPEIIGGLQTSTDDLCSALIDIGVEPIVLCGQHEHGPTQGRMRADTALGYRTLRSPDPIRDLPAVVASLAADAVVVQSGTVLAPLLVAALQTDAAVLTWLHNVETSQLGGSLVPDPAVCHIANSAFTARRWQALCGIDCAIIAPAIRPHRYMTRRDADARHVLFVNPVPIKGVEIAFDLAASYPDVPFRFVESWTLEARWRDYCRHRADALGNIDWLPAQADMAALYRSTRLLLMPSIWEETFGRTVIEAQVNGIPVLASRRGGLPESVGAGGWLLDPDGDLTIWRQAFRRLWADSDLYNHISAAATANALRPDFAAPLVAARFASLVAQHIAYRDNP